jgi:hypothetical protein
MPALMRAISASQHCLGGSFLLFFYELRPPQPLEPLNSSLFKAVNLSPKVLYFCMRADQDLCKSEGENPDSRFSGLPNALQMLLLGAVPWQ